MASEYLKLSDNKNNRSYYVATQNSVCLGPNCRSSNNCVSIGSFCISDRDSLAIGSSCNASYYGLAIGSNNIAKNKEHDYSGYGVAIGYNCTTISGVSIGHDNVEKTGYSVAIGSNCKVGVTSIAIGQIAEANHGYFCIAIGCLANAWGTDSEKIGAIAIGYNAKAGGLNEIAIGTNTNTFGWYSTSLGYNAATSEFNCIQLGSLSELSKLSCRVALSMGSDARDKADILPVSTALDFVNTLKPVTYVFNHRNKYFNYITEIDEQGNEIQKLSDEDQEAYSKYGICQYDKEAHAQGTKKDERRRIGFLAQDLQESIQACYGTDNYADIVSDNFHDYNKTTRDAIPDYIENQLSVNYTGLIPFLTRAIQEVSAQNTKLKETIKSLINQNKTNDELLALLN